MKTVKELKEFLEGLDDDIVIVRQSDNFELKGNIESGIYMSVEKMKVENREFIDGFDGTKYFHDVYIPDENGRECLHIY